MKLGFFLFATLSAIATYGQAAFPTVEFILFSGRDRPKAVLAQATHAQTARDSLLSLAVATFPCADLPDMGSTPLYNGVLVNFPEPVLDRKTMVIQKGFIHFEDGKPCYRDADSRLEALLVSLAFEYEDLNAPQGPRPMDYLACMVPDSLHPGIAPCETSQLFSRRRAAREAGVFGVGLVPGMFGDGSISILSLTGRRRTGSAIALPQGEDARGR